MDKRKYYIEKIKEQKMMSDTLYAYMELREFKRGERLLRQGERLEYLYILVEGRIKSCHTSANGMVVLATFSKPIMVVGEVEFLNHREIINDVYALEDSVCMRMNITKCEDNLVNDLLFMRYLAKTVSFKLYDSNQNTSISMNYPVENRLASYLIACHEEFIIKENFVQVAEMIGCSYRQLQRILNHFSEQKYIIKIKRGQYQILDITALSRLGQDLYFI